ncbi:nicotinate-nucleotide adenylyltransferase [Candidatus Nitronereus thalassa]|uniref:Probable nicotinate-nucleotide adenylyltransferase n=1 Tax=Candidatus Nitronereus thalassa TaxID=3020898 RepID=A0ABU3KAW1_9BACT|nr:nicotinate-nucleotide adenylyltransferase [Candidatus Nitronereus thalassa]MDT7043487.1 nicotinate-nucleotide adenylyltransferase [Candidatus Nitronereus thalassa]
MKIGLLGGTFNPIHKGHLHIADQTRTRLGFDQILFIPTGDPPHKSLTSLAPAHHRLAMVKLATQPFPYFQVSDIEATSSETCYTIDTLNALKDQIEGELFFLVGLDAFLDFPTWKAADQLFTNANFIVLSRPGVQFAETTALPLLPRISEKDVNALDQGVRDHVEIPTSPSTTITFLALPPCDISASAIRDRLQKGLSVTDWLPAPIESYIIEHHLYGT